MKARLPKTDFDWWCEDCISRIESDAALIRALANMLLRQQLIRDGVVDSREEIVVGNKLHDALTERGVTLEELASADGKPMAEKKGEDAG